jgi:hypothetical protein
VLKEIHVIFFSTTRARASASTVSTAWTVEPTAVYDIWNSGAATSGN